MLFYGMGKDEVLDDCTPAQAELLLAVARDEEDRRFRVMVMVFHAPNDVLKAQRVTMPGVEKKRPDPVAGLAKLAMLMRPKDGQEIARKINLKAKAFKLAERKNGRRSR